MTGSGVQSLDAGLSASPCQKLGRTSDIDWQGKSGSTKRAKHSKAAERTDIRVLSTIILWLFCSISLRFTLSFHSISLHFNPFHFIPFHSISFQPIYFTPFHSISIHFIPTSSIEERLCLGRETVIEGCNANQGPPTIVVGGRRGNRWQGPVLGCASDLTG